MFLNAIFKATFSLLVEAEVDCIKVDTKAIQIKADLYALFGAEAS